jgi:hypothetical protein
MVSIRFKRHTDEEELFTHGDSTYYFKLSEGRYGVHKLPRILFFKKVSEKRPYKIKKVLINDFIIELREYLNKIKNN